MKFSFLFTCILSQLFFIKPILAQKNLLKKEGVIEIITIINHKKDNHKSIKKAKKSDNPLVKRYFDEHGNLLKIIRYRDNIEETLKEISYINTYEYTNGKKVKENYFRIDGKGIPYLKQYTTYTYNDNGHPLTENIKYMLADSVWYYKNNPTAKERQNVRYEYDKQTNSIKYIYNANFYYITKKDTTNRVISEQQIANGRVRWEWLYTYGNGQHIGTFKSYYDKNNYMETEIVRYAPFEGKAAEREILYPEDPHRNEKKIYHYGKNNVLKRVGKFYFNTDSNKYKLESITDIKVNSKIAITKELAKKLD